MEFFIFSLLLTSSIVAFAEEGTTQFIFPPFANEDVKLPEHPLPKDLSYEERKAIPAEELRGLMAFGNPMDQGTAMNELLERGDIKTTLRLVYAFKQGNVMARYILSGSNSFAPIPYLMEDVAHGSLDYYGGYWFGDSGYGGARLRVDVLTVVDSVLFTGPEFLSPKFSGEAFDSLKAICRGNEDHVQGLSDESRYLVQWWSLNGTAFEAGKWDEIRPLPEQIIYSPAKEDRRIPGDEQWNRETQPPFGSPVWELPESFEDWSKRIVHPELRNLDFVALSWDGEKVVEHPAESLDPKRRSITRQDRESRKTEAPRINREQETDEGFVGMIKAIPWLAWCAGLLVVFGLIRLLVRIKKTR